MAFLSGVHDLLPVDAVNPVQTLKVTLYENTTIGGSELQPMFGDEHAVDEAGPTLYTQNGRTGCNPAQNRDDPMGWWWQWPAHIRCKRIKVLLPSL